MCTRIVLLFTILLGTGCNKGGSSTPTSPTPTPTITTITIAMANAVLFGGSTEQATATATLSNGTTQQATGTWGVDNPNVASVDQNGRVTAQASGRANLLFSSGGVSASRGFRVVPNYQGQWSGSYFITGCAHSGAFAAGNFCADFASGRVLPMNMTLTQGSREVVEGRTFLGTLQTDLVTGPIENDGAVQMSGIVRSGNTSIDVFWRFNALQPGRMVGALRQIWRQAGLSGQGEVAGEFRDMNKQSALTASEMAPTIGPRTLSEAIRAVSRR